jgi:hypothetical protein
MAMYGLQFERQQSQSRFNKFGGADSEGDTFHLEPAIDLLSSYQSVEDFVKKVPLSSEAKLNLFLEIRSLLLRQAQSLDHTALPSSSTQVPSVSLSVFLSVSHTPAPPSG